MRQLVFFSPVISDKVTKFYNDNGKDDNDEDDDEDDDDDDEYCFLRLPLPFWSLFVVFLLCGRPCSRNLITLFLLMLLG